MTLCGNFSTKFVADAANDPVQGSCQTHAAEDPRRPSRQSLAGMRPQLAGSVGGALTVWRWRLASGVDPTLGKLARRRGRSTDRQSSDRASVG